MPELPDVELYLAALPARIAGHTLERVRLATPFLLRSVEPPLDRAEGRVVAGFRRLGKRIVWELEGPSTALGTGRLLLVFHLMIAGRFKWRHRGAAVPRKVGLAAFDVAAGTLLLTEVATQKRASLHVVQGEAALASFNPGGLDVMASDAGAFADALRRESHTLKRALTDPHLVSGIQKPIVIPSDGPMASISGLRSGPARPAFEMWITSRAAIACRRRFNRTIMPTPPTAR